MGVKAAAIAMLCLFVPGVATGQTSTGAPRRPTPKANDDII